MTPGRLPTGGQYQAAVQNPSRCFTDPVLRGAAPERTALGLPKPISGNFASVFPVTAETGERYAVKCFTREAPHQLQRYEVIAARLRALRPEWAADFAFQPEGIRVEGAAYPILRMEWIDAVSLTRWVTGAVRQAGEPARLADRFDAVVASLAAAGIAHGDLQHGNVLVRPDGELRIIDYDGMYLADLAGLPSDEVGHPNYQPPGRTPGDYGPDLDRFSARLISLSLRALDADPALWDHCNPGHEEYLLLDQTDFAAPEESARLAHLLGHSEARVRELGTFVRDCLPLPLASMPELTPPVRKKRRFGHPSRVPGPAEAAPSPAPDPVPIDATAGAGAPSTLPSWLAGRVTRPDPVVSHPSAPATPATPATEAPGTTGTSLGPAWIWAARVLLVLAVLGIAVAALVVPSLGMTVAVLGLAGVAAIFWRTRRTGSALTARLELRRDAVDERLRAIDAAYDQRIEHARGAYRTDRAERDHRRDELATEIADVEAERRAEEQRLLARRQDDHVAARLAGTRLSPRDVDGLTALDVVHLTAAGIRGPADFTGVVHRAARRASPGARPVPTVYLRRPDGTEITVTGIGEAKARRLEWWRNRHLALARRDQPAALTPADDEALEARYAARLDALRDAHARARARAADPAPQEELNLTLRRLDAERRDERTEPVRERTEIGRRLQAARAAEPAAVVPALSRFLGRILRG